MNRKLIAALIVALTLGAAFIYFNGGGKAPAGQPPLQNLTPENVGDLRTEFNSAKGNLRVLLLLSPT